MRKEHRANTYFFSGMKSGPYSMPLPSKVDCQDLHTCATVTPSLQATSSDNIFVHVLQVGLFPSVIESSC